jgi:hypothetical protein
MGFSGSSNVFVVAYLPYVAVRRAWLYGVAGLVCSEVSLIATKVWLAGRPCGG